MTAKGDYMALSQSCYQQGFIDVWEFTYRAMLANWIFSEAQELGLSDDALEGFPEVYRRDTHWKNSMTVAGDTQLRSNDGITASGREMFDENQKSDEKQKRDRNARIPVTNSLAFRSALTMQEEHWIFEALDKDTYPAIPHGHFEHKTLNPFSGYVYATHQRDHAIGKIRKEDLKNLWTDPAFVATARLALCFQVNRGWHAPVMRPVRRIDFRGR